MRGIPVPVPRFRVLPSVTRLLLVASVVAGAGCQWIRPDGPLEHVGEMGWADHQDVGDVFTEGLVIVRPNAGPVKVLDVRPRLNTDGVEYLGAVVAGPEREIGAVTDPGWPVSHPGLGDVVRAEGAELHAEPDDKTHSYVFVLGFRVVKDGRHTSDGVDIAYEYRSRRYRLHVPVTFAVCTTGSEGSCKSHNP